MKKGIGVLVALGAVSLVAAQPALADKKKDKKKHPVVEVSTTTTFNYVSSTATLATYSGTVSCAPAKLGQTKEVRKKRNRAAQECEAGRTIDLFHNGQLIGTTQANGFDWSIIANKPPPGDTIVAVVREEDGDVVGGFLPHCNEGRASKQIF
jgi:hypothetical protein